MPAAAKTSTPAAMAFWNAVCSAAEGTSDPRERFTIQLPPMAAFFARIQSSAWISFAEEPLPHALSIFSE